MEGVKLKELRKKKRLTQQQLADYLNVDLSSIGKWEIHNVTPGEPTLKQIANYFDVSVDYLLGVEKVSDTPQFTQEELELIELYRVAPDTWKKTAKQALALGVGEKVKQDREKETKKLEIFSSDKFKKTL